MGLMGNVPVDDAIRLVGVELSRNNQSVVLGTTPAEKELLARHATKGKQRSVFGIVVGGGVMGGLWRWSGHKSRVLGAVATVSGCVFGMTYGMLSIRRDLFTELLTLPAEQSPFAARARKVLREKIPESSFVRELRERMRSSAGGFDDDWNAIAEEAAAFPPFPQAQTRALAVPEASQRRDTLPTGDEADASAVPARSPFFMFGSSKDADGDADARSRDVPPLSRDPYAMYPLPSASRSDQPRPNGVVRRDEDEYFFGVPSDEDEAPVRATTWEEIRRRAAQREQGGK